LVLVFRRVLFRFFFFFFFASNFEFIYLSEFSMCLMYAMKT